jgi:ribonuclease-3
MTDARREFAELEARVGHSFRDPAWLQRALTHSSRRNEAPDEVPADNERLELLGDAVLSLVVTRTLLERFPGWSVGRLSQARSQLVNSAALHAAAARLELGAFLQLGRGEEKSGLREQRDVLADAYEALVAAVYQDAGLEPAAEFVQLTLLDAALAEHGDSLGAPDQKSALMEWFQARGLGLPAYRVVGESGPDHRKSFRVEVAANGRVLAEGEGSSKKAAEQAAAARALESLRSSER